MVSLHGALHGSTLRERGPNGDGSPTPEPTPEPPAGIPAAVAGIGGVFVLAACLVALGVAIGGLGRDPAGSILESSHLGGPGDDRPIDHSKALLVLVLDRSGSMDSMGGAQVGAVNSFLDKQREFDRDGGTSTDLLLVTFNRKRHIVHAGDKLAEAAAVTFEDLEPSGGTALLDALGDSLTDATQLIAGMSKRPGKVTVFVLTDGHENRSREWRRPRLKALVNELRSQHDWQFIFSGADQDAVVEGGEMGFEEDESLAYRSRAVNYEYVMDETERMVRRYRSGAGREEYAFSNSARKTAAATDPSGGASSP